MYVLLKTKAANQEDMALYNLITKMISSTHTSKPIAVKLMERES